MKKTIFILAAILVGAMSLVSCNKIEVGRQKVAVLIVKNGQFDYFQQIAVAFCEECERNDVQGLAFATDSDDDYQRQLELINMLPTLDSYEVLGIAIAPIWTNDNHKVEQALADYVAKNPVPVVIIDTPVDDSTSPLKSIYRSFVGTDNEAAGRVLAEELAAATAANTKAVRMPARSTDLRLKGVRSVVGDIPCVDVEDKGTIQIDTDLDGVKNLVLLNGNLLGSLTKIYDQIVSKSVNVYTFDFFEDAISQLRIGEYLRGVMAQNTFAMGRQAARDIFHMPEIKMHYIPTIYITEDNLDSADAKPFLDFYKQD